MTVRDTSSGVVVQYLYMLLFTVRDNSWSQYLLLQVLLEGGVLYRMESEYWLILGYYISEIIPSYSNEAQFDGLKQFSPTNFTEVFIKKNSTF